MKKFIIYWFAVVLSVHIIPAMVLAAGLVYFYGTGDAPSAVPPSALMSGISLFIMLMFVIAQYILWPALMVLVIGIVVCLQKSSKKK